MIVNERGQIIGDSGISWCKDIDGLYSIDPTGYFIELSDEGVWRLFRRTKSSYYKIPFIKQIIITGSIEQCIRIAEIYEIRRMCNG